MKPQPQLPAEFEIIERGTLITGQRMIGLVTTAANLIKDLGNFAWHHPLIAQAIEQIGLALLRRCIQPDPCCYQLRQQFGKLTEFEQAGIGVFRKIFLCQHPQAHELFVIGF